MIKIYADFNAQDADKRVRLNTNGSLAEVKRLETELRDGATVELYSEENIAVTARLLYEDGIWLAAPDWNTLKRETNN
jgi:hypothetical protein